LATSPVPLMVPTTPSFMDSKMLFLASIAVSFFV
jgi:hypothetical protein